MSLPVELTDVQRMRLFQFKRFFFHISLEAFDGCRISFFRAGKTAETGDLVIVFQVDDDGMREFSSVVRTPGCRFLKVVDLVGRVV